MNDKEINDILTPIVEELKKNFTGSDDYLSGVNDGMFTMGKYMIKMSKEIAKTEK